MAVELAKYRELYFSEAHEQLGHIAAALRELELAPDERNALEAASRATHTLKGMSATMGYDQVVVLAHAFEDLLGSVRDRPSGPSSANFYPLFQTLDSLNKTIANLESGQSPQSDAIAAESAVASARIARGQGENVSFVRVSSELLDRVMARSLELIASANRSLGAQLEPGDGAVLADWRDHLLILKELLVTAWSLQMGPVGDVFYRFPPMLHDVARTQGKEIRVKIEGEEVEAARKVLEEVCELLLHLLRNAVTHGIEPLAERLLAGKDPRGTITLRACEEGESIIIEVSDDGRGLDAQRILQAAYDQGFISETQRGTLSEAEANELIMRSGFSMAPVVTKASGRGLGMEIVRSKIESLRGTIRTRSRPGSGTTFILQFPNTLGATPVELVRSGEQIFAIRIAQIEAKQALAMSDLALIRQGEISVSNQLLRLVDTSSCFGTSRRCASNRYGLLIVNTRAGVAVRVDEFLGKALWTKPPNGHSPAVPLLDLDHLPAV